MRLTKFGHSGIRIETGATALALDPGCFTQPEVVEGVDAVLITHEHSDHWTPELLRAANAPIYTIEAVAGVIADQAPDLVERTTVVAPGDVFEVLGQRVEAIGELHAVIHEDLPQVYNCGYLMTIEDTRIFHPGDALTLPERDVDLLLAPMSAPWMALREGINFARAVGAPRNLGIHEKIYSEAGQALSEARFTELLLDAQSFTRLADGGDYTF